MIARIALHAVGAVVGLAIGAALVLASTPTPAAEVQAPPSGRSEPAPGPSPAVSPSPATVATAKPAPLPAPAGDMLLAWSPGQLPDGFVAAARAIPGVTHVVAVDGGLLDLTTSHDAAGAVVTANEDGWAIPLDAAALDPERFAAFAPTAQRPLLDRLVPGTVLLGATSARLRGIGVGGQVTLAPGRIYTVVGVVDDAAIGAAEIVLHQDDPSAAALAPRYVLLRHDVERAAMEGSLRAAAGDRPLRVRAPGETPYLRHGDAVLPQAIIKARYGEFRYQPSPADDRGFRQDPDWVREHIVTETVPLLGSVTCHRAAIAPLRAVLAELDRRGLGHTIDADGFAGCWNPRLIAPGAGPSRHSWGIAVDLNAEGNPTGTGSGQHPELVELMTAHGWGWGGTWLIPDPMHFELVETAGGTVIKTAP